MGYRLVEEIFLFFFYFRYIYIGREVILAFWFDKLRILSFMRCEGDISVGRDGLFLGGFLWF